MSEREGRFARLAAAIKSLDTEPKLIAATQRARRRLPGDSLYGDPLSTAGTQAPHVLGRQIAALSAERPSVVRELGFSALQVWQGLSEAQGRGYGDRDLAIMFTDLVDFSAWALHAGDASALELLRQVDLALTSAITAVGGRVVKRLGDGLMAVFERPAQAVCAAHEACRAVAHVRADGHSPQLRVGIHVGRPRKLGGDYFGVDVNIAARIAAAAGGGEVLVSDAVRMHLDAQEINLRPRADFKAKGTPVDLKVYAAEPAPASG
ncbi:MAG: adenylate/guanylate cyclase domain-containing protein [Actinomycetota bacterium]|nr:adenylate/guanylate cyclase domain-containing protein [Actinomycetota bacterium]